MKFSKKQLQLKVDTLEKELKSAKAKLSKAKASKASYISKFRIALKGKKSLRRDASYEIPSPENTRVKKKKSQKQFLEISVVD